MDSESCAFSLQTSCIGTTLVEEPIPLHVVASGTRYPKSTKNNFLFAIFWYFHMFVCVRIEQIILFEKMSQRSTKQFQNIKQARFLK